LIRGAIIGCGKVASQGHMPCYRIIKNVEIVAVCDTSEKEARAFSRRNNIPNTYTEINDLFEKENLDFVDICTTPSTHYPICSNAIDHGLNVLVEKPVALSLEETLVLKDKSESGKVKVCPIHNYRFKENVLKATQRCKEGRVGKIRKIVSIVHSPGPFPDWFWNEETNGGFLYESAIHFIDLQLMLCGDHNKVIGLHKDFSEELKLTTGVSALVEYKSGTIGIIDVNAFSSSLYARLDIFGTASNIHLKFFPDYFSTSLGPFTPYAEFKNENKRFFGYARTLLFGLKKYKRDYHLRLLSEFVKSIESCHDMPVTIDSVIPTMRLLDDLKKKDSVCMST
jgi:predicted dehydrogenase